MVNEIPISRLNNLLLNSDGTFNRNYLRLLDHQSLFGNTDQMNRQAQDKLPYLAIAPSFEWMREWCWRHVINVHTVRYVFELRDARAYTEYNLIMFDRYWEGNNKLDHDIIEQIKERAATVHFTNDSLPIVTDGRIIGWKEFSK